MASIKFDITGDDSGFVAVMNQVKSNVQSAAKVIEELGKNFNVDGIENQMVALNQVIRENEAVIAKSKDNISRWMTDAMQALKGNDKGTFDAIQKDINDEIIKVRELTEETKQYQAVLMTLQGIDGSASIGETAPMLFNTEEEYRHVEELRDGIEQLKLTIASFDGSESDLQGLRSQLSAMKGELRDAELSAAKNAASLGEEGKQAAEASVKFFRLTSAVDEQKGVVNELTNRLNQAAEAMEKAKAGGDTAEIDEATIKYDNLAESLQGAKMHLINLEQEQEVAKQGFSGDPTVNIRTQLRNLTQEIAELTLKYRDMSAEEKSSAQGRELQARLEQLTQKAGDLRDAMDDVRRAIQGTASDTKNFDAMAQGINVVTSSFGAVTGAAAMFGVKQEDLLDIQAKLQASLAISNALSVIQNNVQKESSLMLGIATIQKKASTVATNLETVAKGGNTVATWAATAAQAAFNAVAKANPYVLLATAVVTVVGALAAFTLGSKKATEAEKARQEAEEKQVQIEEELRRKEEEHAKMIGGKYSSTLSDLMANYKKLQIEYANLKNNHERTEWIKENASEFKKLGVSVNTVDEAENVLVDETETMVRAFQLRAQAAAAAAEAMEAYTEAARLEFEKQDHMKKVGSQWHENDIYHGDISRYGLKEGRDFTWNNNGGGAKLTAQGAEKANQEAAKLSADYNKYDQRIADLNAQAERWIQKQTEAETKIQELMKSAHILAADNGSGKSGSGKGGENGNDDLAKLEKERAEYAERLKQTAKERARIIKDMEFSTRQAQIDAMEEGSEKSLRQMQLDFQRQSEELKRGYEDLKQKKIDDARSLWEANPNNNGKVFDASKVNTEYTAEEVNNYKSQQKALRQEYIQKVANMDMPDLSNDYIQKRIAEIKEAYKAEVTAIQDEEDKLKSSQGGTLTKDQSQEFVQKYEQAQVQMENEVKLLEDAEVARAKKKYQSLMNEYKTYDQQRRDIEQKYNDDMAILNKELERVQGEGADTSSIQSTIQERTRVYREEIHKLQSDILQSSEFYNKLFGDASEKGYKVLKDFYQQAKETLDNAKVLTDGVEIKINAKDDNGKMVKKTVKVTVEEFQKMKKQVKSIQTELEKKNPFTAFKTAWSDMVKEFKNNGDVSGAVKKLNDKGKELTSTFNSWGDSLGSVFGDNFTNSVNEMMTMVDGVMDMGTGIAQIYSGDIVGGISNTLSGLSSVIDMFSSWEEKRKEMERQWYIAEIETNAAMRERNDEYAALRSTISDILKGEESLNWLIKHGMAKESSVTIWKTMEEQLKSYKTNLEETEKDFTDLRNKLVTEGRGYYEWGNSINGGSEEWGLKNATDAQLELWYNQDKLNDAARQYYEAWKESGQSAEELRDKIEEIYASMQEAVMGTNFDGFLSNTMQALKDARSGVKNLAEYTEDTLSEALMNAFMYKYMAQALEPLYNELAEHMIDGTTDKDYLEQWKSRYDQFFANANAELDKLEEYTGVKLGSGGSKYEQEGSKGGWSAVGQESVDELNGRFAALQISGEKISDGIVATIATLTGLSATVDSNSITLVEIRNLMITNNAFLEDMLSVNRDIFKEFGKKLDKISTNTK